MAIDFNKLLATLAQLQSQSAMSQNMFANNPLLASAKLRLQQLKGNPYVTNLTPEQFQTVKPLVGNSLYAEKNGSVLADLSGLARDYVPLEQDFLTQYSALPKIAGLQPTQLDGLNLYKRSDLTNALNAYQQLDVSKLGDTWLEQQLKTKTYTAGGKQYIDQDTFEWAQDPFKDIYFIDPNTEATYKDLGLTLDPTYNSFWGRMQLVDAQGNKYQPFSWNAADARQVINQKLPASAGSAAGGVAPLFAYLDMGYKKDPVTGALKESAFFLPKSVLTPYVDDRGSNQSAYWFKTPEDLGTTFLKYGAYGKGTGGAEGFIFPSWDAYSQAMKAAGSSPYSGFDWEYKWSETDDGGFLGSVVKVFDAVAPILAFTPLAPYAAAWNLGRGLGSGNIGQAIGGALGVAGSVGLDVPGALGSSISSGLGLNLSQQAMNAIGSAAISAGTGALSGQKFSDVLKSAALSGGGSYLNSALFDKNTGYLKDATPVQKIFAQAALRGGMTGLGGGNPLQGALGSLIGSGAGVLGNAAQQQTGSKFVGGLTSGATSALLRAMLMQNMVRR